MAGFPEYLRVFTAVTISADARTEVHRQANALLADLGRLSVVAEENLHVTLKFVGEVHRDDHRHKPRGHHLQIELTLEIHRGSLVDLPVSNLNEL